MDESDLPRGFRPMDRANSEAGPFHSRLDRARLLSKKRDRPGGGGLEPPPFERDRGFDASSWAGPPGFKRPRPDFGEPPPPPREYDRSQGRGGGMPRPVYGIRNDRPPPLPPRRGPSGTFGPPPPVDRPPLDRLPDRKVERSRGGYAAGHPAEGRVPYGGRTPAYPPPPERDMRDRPDAPQPPAWDSYRSDRSSALPPPPPRAGANRMSAVGNHHGSHLDVEEGEYPDVPHTRSLGPREVAHFDSDLQMGRAASLPSYAGYGSTRQPPMTYAERTAAAAAAAAAERAAAMAERAPARRTGIGTGFSWAPDPMSPPKSPFHQPLPGPPPMKPDRRDREILAQRSERSSPRKGRHGSRDRDDKGGSSHGDSHSKEAHSKEGRSREDRGRSKDELGPSSRHRSDHGRHRSDHTDQDHTSSARHTSSPSRTTPASVSSGKTDSKRDARTRADAESKSPGRAAKSLSCKAALPAPRPPAESAQADKAKLETKAEPPKAAPPNAEASKSAAAKPDAGREDGVNKEAAIGESVVASTPAVKSEPAGDDTATAAPIAAAAEATPTATATATATALKPAAAPALPETATPVVAADAEDSATPASGERTGEPASTPLSDEQPQRKRLTWGMSLARLKSIDPRTGELGASDTPAAAVRPSEDAVRTAAQPEAARSAEAAAFGDTLRSGEEPSGSEPVGHARAQTPPPPQSAAASNKAADAALPMEASPLSAEALPGSALAPGSAAVASLPSPSLGRSADATHTAAEAAATAATAVELPKPTKDSILKEIEQADSGIADLEKQLAALRTEEQAAEARAEELSATLQRLQQQPAAVPLSDMSGSSSGAISSASDDDEGVASMDVDKHTSSSPSRRKPSANGDQLASPSKAQGNTLSQDAAGSPGAAAQADASPPASAGLSAEAQREIEMLGLKRRALVAMVLERNHQSAAAAHQELLKAVPADMLQGTGTGLAPKAKALYTCPQEAPSFQANQARHRQLASVLQRLVQQRRDAVQLRECELALQYRTHLEFWKQQMQGKKGAARANGNGLALGPAFARQGSRKGMMGTARSDYEEMQIVSQLQAIDRMKTMVQIPPLILDARERDQRRFITTNCRVPDPVAVLKEEAASRPWSTEEKRIFMDRFLQFPKDFRKIADGLPHRSVGDCIVLYYKIQKLDEFAAVRRKQQLKKRRLQSEVNRNYNYLGMASTAAAKRGEGPVRGNASRAAGAYPEPPSRAGRAARGRGMPNARPGRGAGRGRGTGPAELMGENGPGLVPGAAMLPGEDVPSTWSDLDETLFLDAVRACGKDMKAISRHMGTKTAAAVKSFYYKHRRRLALDQILEERMTLQSPEQLDDEAGMGMPMGSGVDPSPPSGRVTPRGGSPEMDEAALQATESLQETPGEQPGLAIAANLLSAALTGDPGGPRELDPGGGDLTANFPPQLQAMRDSMLQQLQEQQEGQRAQFAQGILPALAAQLVAAQHGQPMLPHMGLNPAMLHQQMPQLAALAQLQAALGLPMHQVIQILIQQQMGGHMGGAHLAGLAGMQAGMMGRFGALPGMPGLPHLGGLPFGGLPGGPLGNPPLFQNFVAGNGNPGTSMGMPSEHDLWRHHQQQQQQWQQHQQHQHQHAPPPQQQQHTKHEHDGQQHAYHAQQAQQELLEQQRRGQADAGGAGRNPGEGNAGEAGPGAESDGPPLGMTHSGSGSMLDASGMRRSLSYWSHDEKDTFMQTYKTYGRDWDRLQRAVPTKTITQIKNYYQNYKTKLGLDRMVLPPGAVGPGSRKRKIDSDSPAGGTPSATPPLQQQPSHSGSDTSPTATPPPAHSQALVGEAVAALHASERLGQERFSPGPASDALLALQQQVASMAALAAPGVSHPQHTAPGTAGGSRPTTPSGGLEPSEFAAPPFPGLHTSVPLLDGTKQAATPPSGASPCLHASASSERLGMHASTDPAAQGLTPYEVAMAAARSRSTHQRGMPPSAAASGGRPAGELQSQPPLSASEHLPTLMAGMSPQDAAQLAAIMGLAAPTPSPQPHEAWALQQRLPQREPANIAAILLQNPALLAQLPGGSATAGPQPAGLAHVPSSEAFNSRAVSDEAFQDVPGGHSQILAAAAGRGGQPAGHSPPGAGRGRDPSLQSQTMAMDVDGPAVSAGGPGAESWAPQVGARKLTGNTFVGPRQPVKLHDTPVTFSADLRADEQMDPRDDDEDGAAGPGRAAQHAQQVQHAEPMQIDEQPSKPAPSFTGGAAAPVAPPTAGSRRAGGAVHALDLLHPPAALAGDAAQGAIEQLDASASSLLADVLQTVRAGLAAEQGLSHAAPASQPVEPLAHPPTLQPGLAHSRMGSGDGGAPAATQQGSQPRWQDDASVQPVSRAMPQQQPQQPQPSPPSKAWNVVSQYASAKGHLPPGVGEAAAEPGSASGEASASGHVEVPPQVATADNLTAAAEQAAGQASGPQADLLVRMPAGVSVSAAEAATALPVPSALSPHRPPAAPSSAHQPAQHQPQQQPAGLAAMPAQGAPQPLATSAGAPLSMSDPGDLHGGPSVGLLAGHAGGEAVPVGFLLPAGSAADQPTGTAALSQEAVRPVTTEPAEPAEPAVLAVRATGPSAETASDV